MIKLRKLAISGFRGARFSVPLDFLPSNKSVAIFGENASGKSTVTDALEWFIHGRVDHLWKEDCYVEALRNVRLDPGEHSEVTVEFSNSAEGTKRISSALQVSATNGHIDFLLQVKNIGLERVFLRHAQISEFIQKSKTEKRKAIASIIGYDDISRFRDVIKSTQTGLQRNGQYGVAKQHKDDRTKQLLELAGKIITSLGMLYDEMNESLKKAGFDLKVSDKNSYEFVDKTLREKTNHDERVEKKLLLDEMLADMAAFRQGINNLAANETQLRDYNDLVLEKDAINQIHLNNFLAAGIKVLAGAHDEPNCPFCMSPYDLDKLRTEVRARSDAISQVSQKLQRLSPAVSVFLARILETKNICEKLARYEKLDGYEKLLENARKFSGELAELHSSLGQAFKDHEQIRVPARTLLELGGLEVVVAKHEKIASTQSGALKFNEYEAKIINLRQRLKDLRESFFHFDKNSKIVASFEKQILALGEIFDRFVGAQNAALQTVLDKISTDVGKYYGKLHPDEDVDNVKLRIVGEEGIEFEYLFHGTPRHPPRKYLSESHLNSLGIVLFLASAKIFNRTSRFLVLDDIVTSFDVNHRRRLLRLIKEEFSDWQIVLLTHESFWFDIIKKELGPEGWQFHEFAWDDENGIQVHPTAKDLFDLIAIKRQRFDVSNDVRKLLEMTLKEICYSCKVKMEFRYNDQNERRMSGELLNELKSTINRKCEEGKESKIFANLTGSNLVATVGSHHNEEEISEGDIDIALSDIKQLHDLFSCPKCHRYVEADRVVAGRNKIACKCGQKELDWKS